MKVIHAANELGNGNRKVCLAIGVFDGVHLGHQHIIRQTISDARQHDAVAVIVTFDKHPNAVVAPDRVPPQISSRPQKLRAIEALGADALLEIPFDKSFSQKSGETFIRELVSALGKIYSICVGADFVFGCKRSGDVALLKKLGAELHFQVHGLTAVALDGQVVSSTRIREAVRAGDFDGASQMLGRPYAIAGRVVHGDRIGHELGFPTANLDVTGLILPPNGVYAASTKVGDGQDSRTGDWKVPRTGRLESLPYDLPTGGKFYRAALNIGVRPTVASPQPQLRVEAHLLDFKGDLYDRELELEIDSKLREERRFSSPSELREQIERDVAAVRGLV